MPSLALEYNQFKQPSRKVQEMKRGFYAVNDKDFNVSRSYRNYKSACKFAYKYAVEHNTQLFIYVLNEETFEYEEIKSIGA